MKHYLLPHGQNFYKANLHCHSTVSDGKLTPEEIKAQFEDFEKNLDPNAVRKPRKK